MEGFTNTQLDVADLPKLEALEYSPLHPKYLTEILIMRVVLSIAFLALLFFGNPEKEALGNAIYLILAGGLLVSGLFIAFGYFGFYKKGFALREKDVSYRSGLIFHSITTVPLNRIQHSEVVRGPLDRFFGLSSVKIYTAGGSSSDVSIPGLKLEEAEKVREFINAKIAQNEVG
jgi:membrane protein YdbS with pleckstrin-like domain